MSNSRAEVGVSQSFADLVVSPGGASDAAELPKCSRSETRRTVLPPCSTFMSELSVREAASVRSNLGVLREV